MSIFYGRKKGLIVLGFGSALYYFSDKIFIQSNKASHFNLIKKDIEQMLWNSNYEDGHIGPLLIRLAWHASGTYDKESNTGGSNGSTMRFQLEANDGANAGLEHARKFMDTLKTKYPNVSYADLWIYASYVAIENMGGPSIPFAYGRVDFTDESKVPPNGRLPNASLGRSHIRDVFYRMGFNDQEITALVGGGHAIGRCHKNRSGYLGPWSRNPLGFGNQFFKELFEQEWIEKNWDGPRQFVNKSDESMMMLPTDLEFRDDPEFRKYALNYKQDEKVFYNDFSNAYKKLTELGCSNLKKI